MSRAPSGAGPVSMAPVQTTSKARSHARSSTNTSEKCKPCSTCRPLGKHLRFDKSSLNEHECPPRPPRPPRVAYLRLPIAGGAWTPRRQLLCRGSQRWISSHRHHQQQGKTHRKRRRRCIRSLVINLARSRAYHVCRNHRRILQGCLHCGPSLCNRSRLVLWCRTSQPLECSGEVGSQLLL